VDQGCGPLKVVFPDGGERLPTGVVATIRWNAPQNMATFDIHYSIDNGGTWKKIASAQTGRAYDWSVPALPGNKPKCKVRVTGRTASGAKAGADLSDAAFLIEVLVLHAPNGGELLGSGSAAETVAPPISTLRSRSARTASARRWHGRLLRR